MAIPFVAAAGASLIGSGISALFGANTASKNRKAIEARQRQIDAGAQAQAQSVNQQFAGLSQLLQSLGSQPVESEKATATNFSFDPITGMPANASMVDTDALFNGAGSKGFNVGQDALMQFLRADPAGKMGGANGVLQEIAATGLPSNLSSIFAEASNVNRDNNAELLSSITGQSRSVGQRFGSGTQRIEGDIVRRLANEQSLQNSQLALQAAEAAAGRRLGAASTLGNFQLQGAGQLLNAGQAQTSQLLQALLSNADSANRTGMFNAQQGQNAAQFNVTAGMQANQQNNAQQMQAVFGNNQQATAARSLQQSALGQAGGIAGQQQSLLNQLLGIRAGTQTAQQPIGSSTGSMLGNSLSDLASIFSLYNRYGGGESVVDAPIGQMAPIFTQR